jgi:hypothetical protein
MKLTIPEFALVVLIGASGSGKSTFARKHFAPETVLTIQPETDLESLDRQFHSLKTVLVARLQTAKSSVIDAPFFFDKHREGIIKLAKQHGARPIAITFTIPTPVLRQRATENEGLSIGKQVEFLEKAKTVFANEGFAEIFALNGVEEINSTMIEISHKLDWKWSLDISKTYQDYGRIPSEPLADGYGIQLDLEYASELVFAKTASDDVIRTALPIVLKDLKKDDGSILRYVQNSSANWLPEEQYNLYAYWFSLWHHIMRDEGAFNRWDWSMPAAAFIQNIKNPEPFLAIWERKLRELEKPAVRHLVNTLLEYSQFRPEFLAWLIQPFIQEMLEKAFYKHSESAFVERISAAEQALVRLKEGYEE